MSDSHSIKTPPEKMLRFQDWLEGIIDVSRGVATPRLLEKVRAKALELQIYSDDLNEYLKKIGWLVLRPWICPITNMEFVWIPGGLFKMGDVFGDGYDHERPVHRVNVSGFWLGKYPVRQKEWEKVMKVNPSFFKGPDHPVEMISWEDTQRFIDALNDQSDGKYRLPTEAEWEYAARSGGKNERYSGSNNVDEVAWYIDNSDEMTHPVGMKKPNDFGLYDMSGNVWEWVQDWEVPYSSEELINPVYVDSKLTRIRPESDHVRRGGSWHNDSKRTRCSTRYDTKMPRLPDGSAMTCYDHTGVRLARNY